MSRGYVLHKNFSCRNLVLRGTTDHLLACGIRRGNLVRRLALEEF
jgi:hypothetical protein